MFPWTVSKPTTYAQLQFDVDPSLIQNLVREENSQTIYFQLGAWFAFLYGLIYMITRRYYDFYMYQEIILNLFKSDPSKGEEPRDPVEKDNQTAADLLMAAQKHMSLR